MAVSTKERGEYTLSTSFTELSRTQTNHLLELISMEINYLMDYWDSLLDGSDTVGALFRDRKESAPISEWVVKVVRLPPDSAELRNPQRYGSILPGSSARPRKRLRDQSTDRECGSLHRVPYGGERGTERHESTARSSKRQRVQEPSQLDTFASDRPIRSREDFDEGLYDSSRSFRVYGSPVHQVDDSQRSPKSKRT